MLNELVSSVIAAAAASAAAVAAAAAVTAYHSKRESPPDTTCTSEELLGHEKLIIAALHARIEFPSFPSLDPAAFFPAQLSLSSLRAAHDVAVGGWQHKNWMKVKHM